MLSQKLFKFCPLALWKDLNTPGFIIKIFVEIMHSFPCSERLSPKCNSWEHGNVARLSLIRTFIPNSKVLLDWTILMRGFLSMRTAYRFPLIFNVYGCPVFPQQLRSRCSQLTDAGFCRVFSLAIMCVHIAIMHLHQYIQLRSDRSIERHYITWVK